MNKKLVLNALALALAPILGASASSQTLTITTFTGPWEIAERTCFVEPFEQKTGVRVVVDPGVSLVTLTKLRQGKTSTGIDVAWMNGGDSERAWSEGLLEPIDLKNIPNASYVADQAIYKINDQVYAVSTGYFALTLLYNTEKVSTPPDSWWDMWDAQYANRVFSLGPAGSLFTPFMMHLNNELGGNNTDFTPVIDRFSQLKAATYYSSTGAIQSAIQSGEVVLGAYYSNTAWSLVDEGVPVAVAQLKEGVPAADQRLHIVKGTPNKALAEQFINYALSPEALNCIAEEMYVGPPLLKPELSERAQERMPWGKDGSLDDLFIPDWNSVNDLRQSLTNLWNRKVIK